LIVYLRVSRLSIKPVASFHGALKGLWQGLSASRDLLGDHQVWLDAYQKKKTCPIEGTSLTAVQIDARRTITICKAS